MIHFTLIGASRAASTWVYHLLRSHPQVTLPFPKPTRFWNRHFDGGKHERHIWAAQGSKRYPLVPLSSYVDRFANAVGVTGDITDGYTQLPDAYIDTLVTIAPSVKVIFGLRNPLELALSHIGYVVRRDVIDYSAAALLLREDGYIAHNMDMTTNIKRWHRKVADVLLYSYEDVCQKPRVLAQRLALFLGIDGSYWDNGSLLPSPVNGRRFSVEYTSSARHLLTEHAGGLVDDVIAFTGWDCSHWLAGNHHFCSSGC